MVKHSEFESANARAAERLKSTPRAISARFDETQGRIVIELSNHTAISFRPQDAEGLESATASELKKINVTPSGFGVRFPRVDADLYVPGLLEGFFGSRKWMAARLGAQGGRATSKAKTAASRANGMLGGRPRKREPHLI